MWPDKGLLAEKLLADRAYTAKLFALAGRQSHEVAIPPVKGILLQREYATHAYKERHLVECFFAKIKSFRRAATRYDKLSITFKASVMLAAMNYLETLPRVWDASIAEWCLIDVTNRRGLVCPKGFHRYTNLLKLGVFRKLLALSSDLEEHGV